MGEKNTITWITRQTKQITQADVSCAELLHTRGEREADRLVLRFDSGPYRYRMVLDRREDRPFEGFCERYDRECERLLDTITVSCCLLDSLETDALAMGLTPWVDDNQEESDWMGRFQNVRRVICHPQEPLS